MPTLREKTEKLVENLLDQRLKDNLLTFLWWVEYNESQQTLTDFLEFLSIAEVMIVLANLDALVFGALTEELEAKLAEHEEIN